MNSNWSAWAILMIVVLAFFIVIFYDSLSKLIDKLAKWLSENV